MAVNAVLTVNDGDPVIAGTQIYSGQEVTITATATAIGEDLNDDNVFLRMKDSYIV